MSEQQQLAKREEQLKEQQARIADLTHKLLTAEASRVDQAGALIRLGKVVNALVNRLDLLHRDDKYRSVWTLYAVHGGTYTGPKYDVELEAVRKAIAELSTPNPQEATR